MLELGTAANRYERSILALTSGYTSEWIVRAMTMLKSEGHRINVKALCDAFSCFYLMVTLVETVFSTKLSTRIYRPTVEICCMFLQ